MPLGRYAANVNGIDTILNLTADEAEVRGLKRYKPADTSGTANTPEAKPANKSRGSRSTSRQSAAAKKAAADAKALADAAAAGGSPAGDADAGNDD